MEKTCNIKRLKLFSAPRYNIEIVKMCDKRKEHREYNGNMKDNIGRQKVGNRKPGGLEIKKEH